MDGEACRDMPKVRGLRPEKRSAGRTKTALLPEAEEQNRAENKPRQRRRAAYR